MCDNRTPVSLLTNLKYQPALLHPRTLAVPAWSTHFILSTERNMCHFLYFVYRNNAVSISFCLACEHRGEGFLTKRLHYTLSSLFFFFLVVAGDHSPFFPLLLPSPCFIGSILPSSHLLALILHIHAPFTYFPSYAFYIFSFLILLQLTPRSRSIHIFSHKPFLSHSGTPGPPPLPPGPSQIVHTDTLCPSPPLHAMLNHISQLPSITDH